jgi:hypothetical protein
MERSLILSDVAASLKAFISSRGADYVTAVRVIEETKSAILDVPRERVGDTASGRLTSARQLARLASDIKKSFDLSVTFAMRSQGDLAAIEAGLRATLDRRYPDVLSEVVFSFPTKDRAEVLFRLSGKSESVSGSQVQAAIVTLLDEANFLDVQVEELATELPLPSLMNVLRAVKVCAPATVEQLACHLEANDFSVPTIRWLSSKLDVARKREWVLRSNDGVFALTVEGLKVVPAARRRNSTDIERVLALGKRKKW